MGKQTWLYGLALFGNLVLVSSVISPKAKCNTKYNKVGCFKERQHKMVKLLSFRDNVGEVLNWKDFATSIRRLACKCAGEAKKQGYHYFVIRYWGECHAGKEVLKLPAVLNDPTKKSTHCANGMFHKCKDTHAGECVGKTFTEYLYIVGEYLHYQGKWSSCSKSCGDSGIKTSNYCAGYMEDYVDYKQFSLSCWKQKQSCNSFPCGVVFEDWGTCSKACGGGYRYRWGVCPSNQRLGRRKRSKSIVPKSRAYFCPKDGGRFRFRGRCNTHKC